MVRVVKNRKVLPMLAAACSLALMAGTVRADVLQEQEYFKDYRYHNGNVTTYGQWLSTGVFYNPDTGHYYEMYVTSPSYDSKSSGHPGTHLAFSATRTFTNPVTGELMQGYLATVTSAAENKWIIDTFVTGKQNSHDWDFSRSYVNPALNWYNTLSWGFSDGVMIGLYNRDGQWAWTTGEEVDYTNFTNGVYPSTGESTSTPGAVTNTYYNLHAHWAKMLPSGRWSNTDETCVYGLLVEYSPGTGANVPEPASLAMLGCATTALLIRRK